MSDKLVFKDHQVIHATVKITGYLLYPGLSGITGILCYRSFIDHCTSFACVHFRILAIIYAGILTRKPCGFRLS